MSTRKFAVHSFSTDTGDNRILCMPTEHLIASSNSCWLLSVVCSRRVFPGGSQLFISVAEVTGSSLAPATVSRAVSADLLLQFLCARASGAGTDSSPQRRVDSCSSGHQWASPGPLWAQPSSAGRRRGAFLPDARMEVGAWPWRHGFILRPGSSNCPVSFKPTQTVFLRMPFEAISSPPQRHGPR